MRPRDQRLTPLSVVPAGRRGLASVVTVLVTVFLARADFV
jgi:hypothetical protein